MGRTQPSDGRPPAATLKAARAKDARNTVNKSIPALLASHARARQGVDSAELVTGMLDVQSTAGVGTAGRTRVRLVVGDVLSVAAGLRREARNALSESSGAGKKDAVGLGAHSDRQVNKGTTGEIKETREMPRAKRKTPRGRQKMWDSVLRTGPSASGNTTSWADPQPRAYPAVSAAAPQTLKRKNKTASNIGVLNAASPLRPGGGFLNGAAGEDEDVLCGCTTLLASLREEFYRLPEVGGVWTPDALVFRERSMKGQARARVAAPAASAGTSGQKDSGAQFVDMPRRDMWYLDVLSAGMLRFPDVVAGKEGEGASGMRYALSKDRRLVERKMRCALRLFASKGTTRVVLPAWGVGTYGNPAGEVAAAWRKVLREEEEAGLRFEEVVFAVRDGKVARVFGEVFNGEIEVEEEPCGACADGSEVESEESADDVERRARIAEMRASLSQIRNPELYARTAEIVADLERGLAEKLHVSEGLSEEQSDDAEDFDESEDGETGEELDKDDDD